MRKFVGPMGLVFAALSIAGAVAATVAGTSVDAIVEAQGQQEQRGRGDDLARIREWRTFLDRASRAFFATRMNTEEVQAKVEEAAARIEALEAARNDPDDEGGRSDITGDVPFLERAQRAFTAAGMNTAAVNRWLEEAREGSGRWASRP